MAGGRSSTPTCKHMHVHIHCRHRSTHNTWQLQVYCHKVSIVQHTRQHRTKYHTVRLLRAVRGRELVKRRFKRWFTVTKSFIFSILLPGVVHSSFTAHPHGVKVLGHLEAPLARYSRHVQVATYNARDLYYYSCISLKVQLSWVHRRHGL